MPPSPAVPKDYEDLLSYYTKHGFRVIAIAGKSVPGLTWLKAQRMKRYVFCGYSSARPSLTDCPTAESKPSRASTSSA